MRTGDRFEALEILVDCYGFFFRAYCKLDVSDSGSHSGLAVFTNTRYHRRRRFMREQQALGILRISQAVIEQVPVQSIGPGAGRMTTGTALPALETKPGVVEQHLTLSLGCHVGLRAEGYGCSLESRFGVYIHDGQAVGEILGDISFVTNDGECSQAFARQLDTLSNTVKEAQFVGDVRGGYASGATCVVGAAAKAIGLPADAFIVAVDLLDHGGDVYYA